MPLHFHLFGSGDPHDHQRSHEDDDEKDDGNGRGLTNSAILEHGLHHEGAHHVGIRTGLLGGHQPDDLEGLEPTNDHEHQRKWPGSPRGAPGIPPDAPTPRDRSAPDPRAGHRSRTAGLSQSGSIVMSPTSDSAILSSTDCMSRCRGVPS